MTAAEREAAAITADTARAWEHTAAEIRAAQDEERDLYGIDSWEDRLAAAMARGRGR
jgi:hypothetical protein